jgi:hypothetical protein
MMPRIGEKLGAPARVNLPVKHIVGDALQNPSVVRQKDPNLDGHQISQWNANQPLLRPAGLRQS